jgi:hypothetical protein
MVPLQRRRITDLKRIINRTDFNNNATRIDDDSTSHFINYNHDRIL